MPLSDYQPLLPRRAVQIDALFSLHYFKYVNNFAGVAERHNFWEAVYVDDGEVEILAGEKTLMLHKGEMVFHAPNELHNVFARGCFASVLIFSFSCHGPDVNLLQGRIFPVGQTERRLLAALFEAGAHAFCGPYDLLDQKQLARNPHAPYGAEQLYVNLLENLLLVLLGSLLPPAGLQPPVAQPQLEPQADKELVAALHLLLAQHVYGNLSLRDICRATSFSKSYLEKRFKQQTGLSVMAYYRRLKTDEAKRLISRNCYTVTEISEKLGFSSVHYFSRVFKANTGMSPTSYAKSVLNRSLL